MASRNKGFTFHSMSLSVCMIGLYLFKEGWLLFGAPSTHRMSSLSLAMYIHTTILG